MTETQNLSRTQIINMTIEELMTIWETDSKIDETELAMETLKINSLNAKYYNILSTKNLMVKKVEAKLKRIFKIKYEYYTGKTTAEDLKKYNWPQFQYHINKADLPTYLEADKDIILINEEKDQLIEMVDYCKGVIKELNNRTWQIKNAIDFHKLTRGMQ